MADGVTLKLCRQISSPQRRTSCIRRPPPWCARSASGRAGSRGVCATPPAAARRPSPPPCSIQTKQISKKVRSEHTNLDLEERGAADSHKTNRASVPQHLLAKEQLVVHPSRNSPNELLDVHLLVAAAAALRLAGPRLHAARLAAHRLSPTKLRLPTCTVHTKGNKSVS